MYKNLLLNLVLLLAITSFAFAGGIDQKQKIYPPEYFQGNGIKGLSTAKVFSVDKVVSITFTNPYTNAAISTQAGTFNGDVNGNSAKFYCIDLRHNLAFYTTGQPHTYTDSGNTVSKITYILNNYYPYKSLPYAGALAEEREAASVQMAIWKMSDNIDINTLQSNADIKARANAIANDAELNAGEIVPVETLVLTPLQTIYHTGTTAQFYVTAYDHNNVPLPNITVNLLTTNGTLGSTSAVTGANGRTPIITLTQGNDSTAVITAKATVIIPQGTKYVHKLEPNNYQKLVLATPTSALKECNGTINWMTFRPLTPILECVIHNSDNTYTANFGYLNENTFAVTIPVGADNQFSPAPANRGQLTSFQPGRSSYWPNPAFSVTFDGSTIVWTVKGPDNVIRTATASSSSSSCVEHVYFTKKWFDKNGIELLTPPVNLPAGYKITVTSDLGNAVGKYIGGILKFTYSNNNTTDTTGLLVDINASYTVAEENLPAGWAALEGVGTFSAVVPGGAAVNPYLGSDKSGLHTIKNKQLPTGSIGDKLWNDINKNGLQDSGELGISNAHVYLYSCDNVLLFTTLTDANGNYLFGSLTAGNYYVKFELPSGYVFTTALVGLDRTKDSDADINTGKTACLTLASGENNLTVDAGVYVPAPPTHPQLKLEKSDGIIFMKPVGENDTYTIKYKNIGDGALLNAVIVDTLPLGLNYVSCSGAISCNETANGSDIVAFNLGTVAPGDSGIVTVTASVSSVECNYTNYAFFGGTGEDGNHYYAYAYDCDIADTTSGGGGGGVESRGDLAELLLLRQLKIRYGMTTPILSDNGGPAGITSAHSLQELIPVNGPFSSTGVEVTPFDILGISNAISAFAMDYNVPVNSVNRTVAVIFSTITAAPNIYDHTKAVCDRLAGSELKELKLIDVNGHNFYGAKLYNPNTGMTDFAISFSVYETASGYQVENKWTYSEYNAPANSSFVYNFQVWSAAYPSTVELVQSILSKFSSFGPLSYMNNNQNVPDIFVKKVEYKHTGKVNVTVNNSTNASSDISFTIHYRPTQGAEQLTLVKNCNAAAGESELQINIGIIADANLTMNTTSGFKDETYVSGGTYVNLSGTSSTVTQFITNNYPAQQIGNYPEGSVIMAGGARITGVLNDWVSVMRSLTPGGTAYNLSGYNKLRFEANGSGVLSVLIDMTTTQGYNYHYKNINLTASNQVYVLNLNEFTELWGTTHTPVDPAKIRMIAFQLTKDNNQYLNNFNYEVKNVAFYPSNVTGIKETEEAPKEFSLAQNYPNPFNPSTVIEFAAAKKEMLKLTVYDILGQEVMVLLNKEIEPGVHKVSFDAAKLSSGIYIYKLTGNSINISKKMILSK